MYSENGEARVEVRDFGIGISEENQHRIFQQFERVTAKHAVAGLGLSLGFGAQAVTAAATARCLAAARAEAVAGFWLDAVCDGRAADARGMCGPDAASRVEEAAACCNGGAPRIHCAGAAEVPGSWAVTVSRGDCRLELVVEPAVSTTAGRATERWLVTSLVRSPARGGQ